jgi:hypothetical protein
VSECPSILSHVVFVFNMSSCTADLRNQPVWIKSEFVEKLEFCAEFHTEIVPDSTVNDVRDFRGLLFSIY